MGETTAIEWATATFNPWIGCTKVSPGCAHCYAERDMDHRRGRVKWGKGNPRSRTSVEYWKQPLRWNRAAIDGIRPRVFCSSLADVLDDEVPIEWLADLLHLISLTPHLDWLLLTKRPQNWGDRIHLAFQVGFDGDEWASYWLDGDVPANVWMGTTVEDQQRAVERIPHLLEIPARVRFLSCEPMVGPVDLREWLNVCPVNRSTIHAESGAIADHGWGWEKNNMRGTPWKGTGLSWIICGGESGPQARPMHPEWARTLRDQTDAAGVPFLFKQWGEWLPGHHYQYSDAATKRDPALEQSRVFCMDWDGERYDVSGGGWSDEPSDDAVYRVGKKAAGRSLDGRTWDGFPVTA